MHALRGSELLRFAAGLFGVSMTLSAHEAQACPTSEGLLSDNMLRVRALEMAW